MDTLLLRVRPAANPKLDDDEFVTESMQSLMERWPQIKGYQWERVDDSIQILMLGEDLTKVNKE